jgi:hypothetical protein
VRQELNPECAGSVSPTPQTNSTKEKIVATEAVPRRERCAVKIKRTMNNNVFTIVGSGGNGIQRRDRRMLPPWVLDKLATMHSIDAVAFLDIRGRWVLAPQHEQFKS